MAKTFGREATLEISTDGSTWVAVTKAFDFDVDHGEMEVDSHTNDDAGYMDYERIWQQLTLTFSYFPDISEASHDTLLAARRASTNLYWRFREKGAVATATGKPNLAFRGIPKLAKGAPRDGLHTIRCTVRSKGTVTDDDQA